MNAYAPTRRDGPDVLRGSNSDQRPPTSMEMDARRWRKVQCRRCAESGPGSGNVKSHSASRWVFPLVLLPVFFARAFFGLGLADHLDRAVAEPACVVYSSALRVDGVDARRRRGDPHSTARRRRRRGIAVRPAPNSEKRPPPSIRRRKSPRDEIFDLAMSRCSASYFRCCSSSLIDRSDVRVVVARVIIELLRVLIEPA